MAAGNDGLPYQVQYDGRGFSGWERKDGTATVQGALEEAARKVFPEFATFPFHVQVNIHRLGYRID